MHNTPIFRVLHKYRETDKLSLHMPGHKDGSILPPLLAEHWGRDIFRYDQTEITGLDNLQEPSGCIREAEELLADAVGAAASFFLVNGTTLGLEAAIFALVGEGSLFLARNSHRSVYDALVFSGGRPLYLESERDEESGLVLGVSPEEIKKKAALHPECRTILFTYPSYEGLGHDIAESFTAAREAGLQIIVDGAHGAHFSLHPELPPSALSLGADVVVESWHKVLPVFTQCSVLHARSSEHISGLRNALNMFQTTSPSYLFLAALDCCRDYLVQEGEHLIEGSLRELRSLRERIREGLPRFAVGVQMEDGTREDPFKIVLFPQDNTGYEVARALEKEGIYPELAAPGYLLFLAGLGFTRANADRLFSALCKVLDELPPGNKSGYNGANREVFPEQVLRPREAMLARGEYLPVTAAVGRISGDYLVPIPPGVPLLVPGERIEPGLLANPDLIRTGLGEIKIKVLGEGEKNGA